MSRIVNELENHSELWVFPVILCSWSIFEKKKVKGESLNFDLKIQMLNATAYILSADGT